MDRANAAGGGGKRSRSEVDGTSSDQAALFNAGMSRVQNAELETRLGRLGHGGDTRADPRHRRPRARLAPSTRGRGRETRPKSRGWLLLASWGWKTRDGLQAPEDHRGKLLEGRRHGAGRNEQGAEHRRTPSASRLAPSGLGVRPLHKLHAVSLRAAPRHVCTSTTTHSSTIGENFDFSTWPELLEINKIFKSIDDGAEEAAAYEAAERFERHLSDHMEDITVVVVAIHKEANAVSLLAAQNHFGDRQRGRGDGAVDNIGQPRFCWPHGHIVAMKIFLQASRTNGATSRTRWGAGPRPTRPRPSSWRRPDILSSPVPSETPTLKALAVAASQERTNVAMFDWIGLYAALYNLEGLANHIIADMRERYECSASRTP